MDIQDCLNIIKDINIFFKAIDYNNEYNNIDETLECNIEYNVNDKAENAIDHMRYFSNEIDKEINDGIISTLLIFLRQDIKYMKDAYNDGDKRRLQSVKQSIHRNIFKLIVRIIA